MLQPPPLPPVTPPPGWRIERHLASGGTAHVFVVVRDDGTRALLKCGRWRERDVHARFELEAEALRTVGATWAPALYDRGAIDGYPYLIMEYVAGETLAAWMSRNGERGGIGEILALLDQLAGGLAAIHAVGVIHRDLKPENAILTGGAVRLIDFGLARPPAGRGLTQIGAVVGTVHYLAPEQVRGSADVDHRVDIYSFGVVAFEMLCGRPPFTGERRAIEYQHNVGRPPSVREWRAVPDELEQLVGACLAKSPEARPQTAADVRARLARALTAAATSRGVSAKPLGKRGRVALVWAAGSDPVDVVRAVAERNGVIVRRRGDGVLAAFTSLEHDDLLAPALAAAQAIAAERGHVVIHAATALLRRSMQGKTTAYGDDLEQLERWLPKQVPAGVRVTAAAAELAPAAVVPDEDAGWYRPLDRDRTDARDAQVAPPLVGRSNLIESLAAIATQAIVDGRPAHVAITGDAGAGKSRVLDAVCERLRAAGHIVVAVRGEPRFPGEAPHDPLRDQLEILSPSADARRAEGRASALDIKLGRLEVRGAVIAIDDAMWLPPSTFAAIDRALAGGAAKLAVLTASDRAVGARAASYRVDVVLPPIGYDDAEVLVRALLRPARLIPSVLVERLALRAGGNPAAMVALTGEIARRGAVRRHVGGEDWYVAADELDTLLAAPSPAWFALRALEDLPSEHAAQVRACAALGPRFTADELAAARKLASAADATAQLAQLVERGLLRRLRDDHYAFQDAALQAALYEHVATTSDGRGSIDHDDTAKIHLRAYRYWLGHALGDPRAQLARLAFHGVPAGEAITATTCLLALVRAGAEPAEALLDRAATCIEGAAPRLHARVLIERGRLRHAARRHADARSDARDARRLAEQARDLELQLDALVVEALAAEAAGDLAAADNACTQASGIATVDIDLATRARVLATIGAARARGGQRDEALTMLQLGRALAGALGDDATAAAAAAVLDKL